ncbi:MAG: hypothetical protein ACRCU0_01635 [Candidatus Rhabdochlamydia sp.]
MSLSFDMTVKTPNGRETLLREYLIEQAFVGFVVTGMLRLNPLSGALLGAATAGSHVIRDHLPEPYNQYCSSTMQKTALLAASFFVSIFCVSLVSTSPISYVKGLIAMVYIHSMGENTMQKIYELGSELKNKIEEISKESLPKKTD